MSDINAATNRSNSDFHVVPNSYSDQDYNEEAEELEEEEEEELLLPEKIEEEPIQPIEWHPAVLMIARVIKSIFSPIARVVFAPRTQRALVKSLVVIIVVAWILMTSFTAYLTFYQRYIPKNAHIEPIYFQYADIDRPQAQIHFRGASASMPLRNEQTYDVSVQLHVPTSDINFNLGNFMVQVELQTSNGTVLARSSRPAILRYQSYAQRILHVAAKALPLLVGWTEESQHIQVMLLESFLEKKATPITQARVTLSTSKLQVYDGRLCVIADFRGLRYYMYHRRISTAFAFILLFTLIEIVCALAAWRAFGENLWNKLHEAFSMEDVDVAAIDEAAKEGDEARETTISQYNTEDDDEDGYTTED